MFNTTLQNRFDLMVNWYDAKIHIPNTGGSFFHNDMNWFCIYEMHKDSVDVYKENISQMVVFMTATHEQNSPFFLIPNMYKQQVWLSIMEVRQSRTHFLTIQLTHNRECMRNLRTSIQIQHQ